MATLAERAPARVRPKVGRDQWALRALALVIGLYLVVTLALPLWAMLSKSFTTFAFRFDLIEIAIERSDGDGFESRGTLQEWLSPRGEPVNYGLAPTARTRIPIDDLIGAGVLDDRQVIRVIDRSARGAVLYHEGDFSAPGQGFDVPASELGRILVRPVATFGLDNYVAYVTSPPLRQSLWNSITIATITEIGSVYISVVVGMTTAVQRPDGMM